MINTSFSEIQYSVGVSPLILDIGDMERGESKIVKFFIVTPSDDPLLVYLEMQNGDETFFKNQYTPLIVNYSEQSPLSWISFFSNPVDLRPSEEIKTVGGSIKGWREVNFLLTIPQDAEPGYHIFRIMPYPSTPSESLGQAGARVISVISITGVVNVKGDVKRSGFILDILPSRANNNKISINTHFKNTGTLSFKSFAINDIYDINGNFITTIQSPFIIQKPGESTVFVSHFDMPEGIDEFKVVGKVSYKTEIENKNITFKISDIKLNNNIEILPKAQIPIELIYLIVIVIIIIVSIIIILK